MTTWQIDPAHTSVEFGVKHMMISTVRGSFSDVSGSVTPADQPTVERDDSRRVDRHRRGQARRSPPVAGLLRRRPTTRI